MVVALIAALSTLGVGVFSGVLDYFRARRSMENLMWDLRKCQQRARSRGHALGATVVGVSSPANFGIAFYKGRLRDRPPFGVDAGLGYSYYVYGPTFNVPPSDLAALTVSAPGVFQRQNLYEIDAGLVPVVDAVATPTEVVPPANSPPAVKRIQFSVDVNSENGDMIPDGTSGLAAPSNFLDFRLHSGEGFFRITFDNDRYIGLRYQAL